MLAPRATALKNKALISKFCIILKGMQGSTYTIGSRHIEVLQKISEGGYAYVYKAQDRATGEIFALKKIM